MKLLKMLYGLTLMLGCFVLASCVNDEEELCLPEGKTQVLFSLVLQDNAQTRADNETWGNFSNPELGVGYDNQIELDKVQFLLFKKVVEDNTITYLYVGTLTDVTYTIPGDPRTDFKYQYVGSAPEGLKSGDYKFVVLANSPVPTLTKDQSTIEDLYNLDFSYLGNNTLPNIPMWGVTNASLEVKPNTREDIGSISLLRAVSKVTVKLQAPEGTTDDPLRGYSLEKVTVSKYNLNGYVVPANYKVDDTTTDLGTESETLHANANSQGQNKEFSPTGENEVTFYLPEYINVGSNNAAVLTVTLSQTLGEGESATTITFEAPIQFCEYYTTGNNQGTPDTNNPYDIIRNHHYQFDITKVHDGDLYVKPTVAKWIDKELEYTINMSTNMRLFDSWLYRYDTDGDYTQYWKWATSHMVVSSGRVTETSTAEPVAGRPLRSPIIQLVTTGSGTFELYVDNDDFEIVKAIKDDESGVVTVYETSGDRIDDENPKGTLIIETGNDVYTYFYIVPKEGVTPDNPEAKVFLYYNDPVLGKLEVPYNYNALPGFSDDSSEIWVYYFAPVNYNDQQGFLKMYYQDASNPLVPVQN
ncbi:MAG: FimB/Mfa2 family fimbrial subunit [Bacteroidaceae bacterium]|nr:FimB/Mfa2 family fimbrial subunit [Bacteroidaceae bacterium]